MPDPADLSALEAAALIAGGELSSVELTDACLMRIEQRDAAFGGWLRVYPDVALAGARAADERIRSGEASALTGVPVALKASIGASGLPLTADSAVLTGNVARADSTAWARLRGAGMVLLGHVRSGEFSCGIAGRNVWDAERTPGGSSSGSAIAVATRTVPVALATDARGSTRIPASNNGLTGVKPTFGLVSGAGCIPLTYTLGALGPIARTAADCSAVLAALAGRDDADRMTWQQPAALAFPTQPRAGRRPLAGARLGIPRRPDIELTPGVAAVFDAMEETLRGLGAELVPFTAPVNTLELDGGADAGWQTITAAEALATHDQYADRAHLYGDEFRGLLDGMAAAMGTAADYVRAQRKRAVLIREWRAAFAEHGLDAVVEPGSSAEPERLADLASGTAEATAFWGTWNDTNFPALSLPGGSSPQDGMPVGIQLAGLPYQDGHLLQLAIDIQAVTDHHLAVPADLHRPLEPWAGTPTREANEAQSAYQPGPHPYESILLH